MKQQILLRTVATTLLFAAATTARAEVGHTDYQARPIQLGTSGGNVYDISTLYCCSGTLGALVQDASGVEYILGNNHVLARVNQGTAGDPVSQPGLIDQNCAQINFVANLTRFIPIQFGKGRSLPDNEVDAAIAAVLPDMVRTDGAIIDIGTVSAAIAPAVEGQNVQKSGRTTGRTFGTVSAVGVAVNVGYSTSCGGRATQTARFVNQFLVSDGTFSAGGDSGSVIFEAGPTPRAVGLLFAGSSTHTIANPMDSVLSALGVSMVGEAAPPPTFGTIAGTVTAGDESGIQGAVVSTDSGQSTTTDSGGAYTLDNVPTGTRTVTATATGYTSQQALADVTTDQTTTLNFVLDPVPVGSQAIVQCVSYNTAGGKTKDLLITISVVDEFGAPVAGAQVDISVTLDGSSFGTGTGGITDGSGQVTYQVAGAPSGTYVTTVTAVSAAGLTFEGSTPDNSFVLKKSGSATFCRTAVSGTTAASNGSKGQAALDRARTVKARHGDALFEIEDVVGHGLSRNQKGEPVIEIYLNKENANARARIPADLENVPVRVIVTGPFVAY